MIGVVIVPDRLSDGPIVRDITGAGWFAWWAIVIAAGVIVWARRER